MLKLYELIRFIQDFPKSSDGSLMEDVDEKKGVNISKLTFNCSDGYRHDLRLPFDEWRPPQRQVLSDT